MELAVNNSCLIASQIRSLDITVSGGVARRQQDHITGYLRRKKYVEGPFGVPFVALYRATHLVKESFLLKVYAMFHLLPIDKRYSQADVYKSLSMTICLTL